VPQVWPAPSTAAAWRARPWPALWSRCAAARQQTTPSTSERFLKSLKR